MYRLEISEIDIFSGKSLRLRKFFDTQKEALEAMSDYFRRWMPSYNIDPTTNKPHKINDHYSTFDDHTFKIGNDEFEIHAHIKKIDKDNES